MCRLLVHTIALSPIILTSFYSGALVTGPSGTGKSALAAAVAERSGAAVIRLDCAELAGRQNGAVIEAVLSRVLARAAKAGTLAGSGSGDACVLILEDVDVAFASSATDALSSADAADGGGLVSTFSAPLLVAALSEFFDSLAGDTGGVLGRGSACLSQAPGPITTAAAFAELEKAASPPRVFVLGTTARPGAVDSRLRRTGRFEVEVTLEAPGAAQRVEILRACLELCCPGAQVNDAELEDLAGRANGYVGADLRAVCAEAAMAALRRRLLQSVASSGAAAEERSEEGAVCAADLAAGLRMVQVRGGEGRGTLCDGYTWADLARFSTDALSIAADGDPGDTCRRAERALG